MGEGWAAVILKRAEERVGVTLVGGGSEETAVLAVYVAALRKDCSSTIIIESVIVDAIPGSIVSHYAVLEINGRRGAIGKSTADRACAGRLVVGYCHFNRRIVAVRPQ